MYEFPDSLERGHFEQMFDLESLYYSEEFIAPADEAWRWYAEHSYSVVAALHEGAVVGFINLFPIRLELFEAIRAGQFNDAELLADDIVSMDELAMPGNEFGMFLSCIVIDGGHRKRGLTKRLLAKAVSMYLPYKGQIRDVVIDTVTADGVAFAQKHGFKTLGTTNHGSIVHVQSFGEFLKGLS